MSIHVAVVYDNVSCSLWQQERIQNQVRTGSPRGFLEYNGRKTQDNFCCRDHIGHYNLTNYGGAVQREGQKLRSLTPRPL